MQKIRESASRVLRITAALALALAAGACDGSKPRPNDPPDAAEPMPDAAEPMPDAALTYVRATVVEVPATPGRDLDLLFVVDDSPSMLDKQANFKSNLPLFITGLEAWPGGLPNLHIGVITSDLGTKASGSPVPAPAIGQLGQGGCSGTGKGGQVQVNGAAADLAPGAVFLSDIAQPGGTRLRNYQGDLATVFGKMASAGAGGCGFEQPLAAVRAALDSNPANVGFLRPGATLGVFFLTDEDDCSARSTTLFGPESSTLGALASFRCTQFGVTCAVGGATSVAMNQIGAKDSCGPSAGSTYIDDVAPYRDFLVGLKGSARRVAVGGVTGDIAPFAVEARTPPGGGTPLPALAHSCSYQGATNLEVADPAVRIKSFFDSFPRSSRTSVCQRDFDLALFSNLLQEAVESSCVDGPIADLDPITPGLQVDCIVEDVAGGAAAPIAACEASPGARPCWQLQSSPTRCVFSKAPQLELVVQRAAAPDPAAITRMRCLVAP